jgi:hypothetical protein
MNGKKVKKNIRQTVKTFVPITYLEDSGWKGDLYLPPNEIYELHIDYPLMHPTYIKIATGKLGMGLAAVLNKIGKAYQKIYDTDDEEIKASSRWSGNEKPRYGIYGHGIEDLNLCEIAVNHTSKTIKLGIGS